MIEIKLNIWQECLCVTYHNDNNYQIFETEKGHFVYSKSEDLVYQITLEGFNKLLVELAALIPPISAIKYLEQKVNLKTEIINDRRTTLYTSNNVTQKTNSIRN